MPREQEVLENGIIRFVRTGSTRTSWIAWFLKCFFIQNLKLRVRFFKKIQDWILKSERIRKWILRFFTRQINPRSFGSWCIRGTEESTSRLDSSVPLMHNDPKDLGLICLVKKRKIHFRILSDFRIQSWIFLKKRTLRLWTYKWVIVWQRMRSCQIYNVPRHTSRYQMWEITRTLSCIYRHCYLVTIELSEWKGSVTYGLGADISLPPYLATGIWNLAPKATSGPKSRGASFGTTLWRHVQRYCACFFVFMLILCVLTHAQVFENCSCYHGRYKDI